MGDKNNERKLLEWKQKSAARLRKLEAAELRAEFYAKNTRQKKFDAMIYNIAQFMLVGLFTLDVFLITLFFADEIMRWLSGS